MDLVREGYARREREGKGKGQGKQSYPATRLEEYLISMGAVSAEGTYAQVMQNIKGGKAPATPPS